MVWTDTAPAAVVALKSMLAQVTAWTGWAANAGDAVHYPQFAAPGDLVAPESLPAGLIVPVSRRVTPYAAGAMGLQGGALALVIYAPITIEASELETVSEAILVGLRQVSAGTVGSGGLANLSGSVELASDPTPGQRAKAQSGQANAAFRTVKLNLQYGLSP